MGPWIEFWVLVERIEWRCIGLKSHYLKGKIGCCQVCLAKLLGVSEMKPVIFNGGGNGQNFRKCLCSSLKGF